MNRRVIFEKVIRLKRWFGPTAAVVAVVVGVFVIGPYFFKKAEGVVGVEERKKGVQGFLGIYEQAAENIFTRMNELHRIDQENHNLKLENMNLRSQVEALQFGCRSSSADQVTKKNAASLEAETGSRTGRNLASIEYRPPSHLLPNQLYTLGLSYFQSRDDEKAAVIFMLLTTLEDSDAYKTPKNHLMAAIAWYRLDNFSMADAYLEKILKVPNQESQEGQEGLARFRAQARLWKGVIAERTNKHVHSQYWLTDLVDNHPHSGEVELINNAKEATREPAASH
ncbi:MAG: hypothetical protein AABZ06_13065 [Bdellovibrionota bacterium]